MANEVALQKIEILKEATARNVVLLGAERNKRSCLARELAAKWLNTSIDELEIHPDFKEIVSEDGILKVEQAEKIQKMAAYVPSSKKAVCIVHDAEGMTVELQNKLLKVLEDGEKTLAVIFVSEKPLIDTVMSRALTVEFYKITLGELYCNGCRELPALLGCDGSEETYHRILSDDWFSQYLDGFYKSFCQIKERELLKNVLKLTHALKEKDKEYLPERLEEWQMSVFLCMIKNLFWHILLKQTGLEMPSYIRIGAVSSIYKREEAENIFRMAEKSWMDSRKKGRFTKNDFFELLMCMIPS